jgi:Fe-S-cluster containining protein
MANNIEPYCKAGCFYCCNDFFFVSDIEFDIIIKELEKWSKNKFNRLLQRIESYWNQFQKKYPTVAYDFQVHKYTFGQLINEINRSEIINKTSIPCPFLDNEGKCSIYNVRPFVCRTFGTTKSIVNNDEFQYKICDLVGGQSEYDKSKFVESTVFDEESKAIFNVIYDARTNIGYQKRGTTILYYAYRHFIKFKQGFNVLDYEYKFKKPIEEYRQQMIKRYGV